MRVLVIANNFPSAAASESGIFILRQLKALERLGHEFLVLRTAPYTPPFGARWDAYRALPDRDTVEGIPVRTLRAFFAPRMTALEYLHLQLDGRIARVVAEFSPALVHAHFLLSSGHIAVQQRLPVVVTAHGGDAYDWSWRRPGLSRAAAQTISRASSVVAVSDFIRRSVRALQRRDDVEVVYNGADEGTFAPADRAEARARLGIGDRFVIAFAGQLTAAKGIVDLLRAAERLHELHPLLLLAGSARHGIRSLAASMRVDARVLGTLDHEQLARVFAAADVVALPSYREGLPAVLCEAMLAARPVVATSVGGVPEIVNEGRSGYLVDAGDVEALAERLAIFSRNAQVRAAFGAAGAAFARRHLTWSVNARRYDEIYRRIAPVRAEEGLPQSPFRIPSAVP